MNNATLYIYTHTLYIYILSPGSIYVVLVQTPPELGGPTHRADVAPVWAHEWRRRPV
jgi:hypothetical protein